MDELYKMVMGVVLANVNCPITITVTEEELRKIIEISVTRLFGFKDLKLTDIKYDMSSKNIDNVTLTFS